MSRAPWEGARRIDRRSTRRAVSLGSETVNITEDVRRYAEDQGIEAEKALEHGMEEKSREFVEKGGEVYTKA